MDAGPDLQWRGSLTQSRRLIQFSVLVCGTVATLVGGDARLESVRKVALWGLLCSSLCLVVNLFTGSTDSIHDAKRRDDAGKNFGLVIRLLMAAITWHYDAALDRQYIIFKLLVVFVLPPTVARDISDGPWPQVFLAVHLAMTTHRFSGTFAEEGWQWVGASVVQLLLMQRAVAEQGERKRQMDIMGNIYGGYRKLLGMLCDGYLLLDAGGGVIGCDSKGASLLAWDARSPRSKSERRTLDTLCVGHRSFAPGALYAEGLRGLSLRSFTGEVVEVEAYVVPWTMPRTCLARIVEPDRVPNSQASFLVAMRMVSNAVDPTPVEQVSDVGDLVMDGPALGGYISDGRALTSDLLEKQGGELGNNDQALPSNYIAEEGSIPSLPSSPPNSVDANAEQPGPPGFAGGPWRAVQSVGIGAGEYKKVRMVGRGGQGRVFEALRDGMRFALKEVPLKGVVWQRDLPRLLHNVDREVRILRSLSWASPVIVACTDCWLHSDFTLACIVMEWLPVTLHTHLKKHRSGGTRVQQAEAVRWTAQLAAGLAAIHYAGFIHRDIKAANVLLPENMHCVKIADLGLSRPLQRQVPAGMESSQDMRSVSASTSASNVSMLSGFTQGVGTHVYSSPEEIAGPYYGCPSDIFALGCLCLEIYTVTPIEDTRKNADTSNQAVSACAKALLISALPPPGEDVHKTPVWSQVAEVCVEMLHEESRKRPTADDVIHKPLLRKEAQDICRQSTQLMETLFPE